MPPNRRKVATRIRRGIGKLKTKIFYHRYLNHIHFWNLSVLSSYLALISLYSFCSAAMWTKKIMSAIFIWFQRIATHKTNNVVQKVCLFAFMKLDRKRSQCSPRVWHIKNALIFIKIRWKTKKRSIPLRKKTLITNFLM